MERSEFIDVKITNKQKFQRDTSTTYLECYHEMSSKELGLSVRGFYIKPKDGVFKDITVGTTSVKYNFNKKQVLLCSLDVESQYQRCGYGEAAVRTLLGIYRSPKNSKLVFDHFYLTVGKGKDREAARNLYHKVGFKIDKDLEEIGYLNLILPR